MSRQKIKTLIFDKGYWDGKSLTKLKKQYGIDFIVPAKANLKKGVEKIDSLFYKNSCLKHKKLL